MGETIWGVGYRSATRIKHMWSIYDGLQLRDMNEEWARVNLGGVAGDINDIKEGWRLEYRTSGVSYSKFINQEVFSAKPSVIKSHPGILV